MAHLTPDKYRQDKVFTNSKNTRAWINAAELFETKQGDTEVLSQAGKARIDAAIADFGEHIIGGAIVVEGYAVGEGSGDELALSRTRATLVRNYLHDRFRVDNQNIGTVPLRGVPPQATHKNSWNGICIVLLAEPS
jgi:outer membrane protein OmpA-like peptidoglycan-associated protein